LGLCHAPGKPINIKFLFPLHLSTLKSKIKVVRKNIHKARRRVMKKIRLLVTIAFFLTPLLIPQTAPGDIASDLVDAAWSGDTARVQELIGTGADANSTDHNGDTALMFAVSRGYPEIMDALIKAGADVNAKDRYGLTALMFAASKGRADFVEALLGEGADVNAKDMYGWTPLMFSETAGNTGIARILEGAGAEK
jgi:ankyrin repeat protein